MKGGDDSPLVARFGVPEGSRLRVPDMYSEAPHRPVQVSLLSLEQKKGPKIAELSSSRASEPMASENGAARGPPEYYYWLDPARVTNGPLLASALIDLRREGRISDETLIWSPSLPNWAAFKSTSLASDDQGVGGKRKRAARKDPPNGEYEFTDDDGTKYVWSEDLGAYNAVASEGGPGKVSGQGDVAPTAAGAPYSVEEMTFDDTGRGASNPADIGSRPSTSKPEVGAKVTGIDALKVREAVEREKQRQKDRAEETKKKKDGWFSLSKNTSVYVTGFPEDALETEVEEYFSKCGVIKLDENRAPKIRLYTNEAGDPKGDGLVTYLKPPSVALACQILDGAPFRPGGPILAVSPAQFQMKGDAFVKKKKPKNNKKRVAGAAKTQEQKALDWSGFEDENQWKPKDITVILKRVFRLEEAQEAPEGEKAFFSDLESDIASECASKCGKVTKVKVFKYNPEGVVQVIFESPQAAAKCVSLMEGRWFGGSQLEADLWDGRTSHNVKKREESEEDQQRRLDAMFDEK